MSQALGRIRFHAVSLEDLTAVLKALREEFRRRCLPGVFDFDNILANLAEYRLALLEAEERERRGERRIPAGGKYEEEQT